MVGPAGVTAPTGEPPRGVQLPPALACANDALAALSRGWHAVVAVTGSIPHAGSENVVVAALQDAPMGALHAHAEHDLVSTADSKYVRRVG